MQYRVGAIPSEQCTGLIESKRGGTVCPWEYICLAYTPVEIESEPDENDNIIETRY